MIKKTIEVNRLLEKFIVWVLCHVQYNSLFAKALNVQVLPEAIYRAIGVAFNVSEFGRISYHFVAFQPCCLQLERRNF